MSDAVKPFRIDVPNAVLDDLRERLERTRFPDQIPGTRWDYGTEVAYLKELCAYWRDGYDWRVHEAALNQFDQFTTTIDGQSIHFLHVRSKHEDAHPLLISHGWPGTIVEFMKVIGPLTDPTAHGGEAKDAFHVVCPSLPGYGFSEPTKSEGWNTWRIAEAFAALMARLGYGRYGAQGGDWGSIITMNLAGADPGHLSGIHLNMPFTLPKSRDGLSEEELADLADLDHFQNQETGYQRIQATKPQTLGVGLNDSPAGLASWIVEKFRTWTDCGGDIESVLTKDELLTNITVYWVTQTITSSTRLYFEAMGRVGRMAILEGRIEVPTGVARFPKEIMRFPRAWIEEHYDVQHWTKMPRGGHFAALEQPELFVEDVRKFWREHR